MEELIWQSQKTEKAHVKIFKTTTGYRIESFMRDRHPQIIKSNYRNTGMFSSRTKWNLGLVVLHGELEDMGLIVPNEELN